MGRVRDGGAEQPESPLQGRHTIADHEQRGTQTKAFSALARTARKSPSIVIAPLAVFFVLAGIGVAVTWFSAGQAAREMRGHARHLAQTAATNFAGQLVSSMSPVETLVALVLENPAYDVVARRFADFSPALIAGAPTLDYLRLAPAGVVRLATQSAPDWVFGVDQFSSANAMVAEAAHFAVQHGDLAVTGPLPSEHGTQGGASLVIRRAIFATASGPNDTFGQLDPVNPSCGVPCDYNATTGKKFWGLAGAVVNMNSFSTSPDARLSTYPILALGTMGLRYKLVAANGAVVVASDPQPRDPVLVKVTMPGTQWDLLVSGHGPWRPMWLPGVIVVVVVCAAVAAALLFAVLLTRRRNQELLEALLPREVIRGLHAHGAGAMLGARQAVTDSPADLLHGLLEVLLAGGDGPDLRDVVLLRSLLMQGAPWYAPVNAGEQIRNAELDSDVARALMRQLGKASHDDVQLFPGLEALETDACTAAFNSKGDNMDPMLTFEDIQTVGLAGGKTRQRQQRQQQDDNARCQTLHGALKLIMAPEPDTFPEAQQSQPSSTTLRELDGTAATEVYIKTCTGVLDGAAMPTRSASSLSLQQQEAEGEQQRQQQHKQPGVLTRLGWNFSSSRPASGSMPLAGGAPSSSSLRLQGLLKTQPSLSTHMWGARARRRSVGPDTTGPERSGATAGSPLAASSEALQVLAPDAAGQTTARLGACLDVAAGPAEGNETAIAAGAVNGEALAPVHARSSAEGGPMSGGGAQRTSDSPAECLPTTTPTVSAAVAARGGDAGPGSAAVCKEPVAGREERPPEGRNQQVDVESLVPVGGTPNVPLLDEVERLLSQCDGLRYDTWALDAATGGHALSAMGFFLLQREGLLARFRVPPARLVRLLRALEAGYPSSNPYHNAVHAADVLRSLHVLLHASRLHEHYVDGLGLLAAYFAAIIHDHGHPGLTGDFLVATSHPLALRYNDRSPLENHHAASAFELLAARPDLDITKGMCREQRAAFRKQVVEMVLATDMKQHFALVGQFTATGHRRAAAAAAATTESSKTGTADVTPRGGGGGVAGAAAAPGAEAASRVLGQASGRRGQGALLGGAHAITAAACTPTAATNHNGVGAAVTDSGCDLAPVPLDEAERLVSLQVALKVADIGHLAGELAVHKRWLGVLEEEFFRQGDQERALGLPISPLFDRAKQGVSKSQVGFFDFVALPLVRAFASAFPGAQTVLDCFEANYQHWVEVQQQQQQQQDKQHA